MYYRTSQSLKMMLHPNSSFCKKKNIPRDLCDKGLIPNCPLISLFHDNSKQNVKDGTTQVP